MFCKCKSDIKQTIHVNLRDKIGYICFVHSFQTELPMQIESNTKRAVRSQDSSRRQFFFFIKSCKICLLRQSGSKKNFNFENSTMSGSVCCDSQYLKHAPIRESAKRALEKCVIATRYLH